MSTCSKCSSIETSRWYKNKTICASCNKKEWYSNNKEKTLEVSRIWHQKNPKKVIAIKAAWFQANKELLYLHRNAKRKEDLGFRISCNLRSRLANALRNNAKTGSAVNDLGCSIEELKIYLQLRFTQDMSWDNYGKGLDKWNIDHITPLCSYDLTLKEELVKACHYSNLQPLWERDNLRKIKDDKKQKHSSSI